MNPNRHRLEPTEHHPVIDVMRQFTLLVVVGLVIGMLLAEVNMTVPLLGLCVLLLLWLSLRMNAAPLLVTLQVLLFFRDSSQVGRPNGLGTELYVVVALGLLAFLSQNQSLQRLISATVPELFRSLFQKPDQQTKPTSVELDHQESGSSSSPMRFVRQMLFLLGCVLLARLMLLNFVGIQAPRLGGQWTPEQLLKPASLQLILVVSTVIVLSELAWRRLTIRQASMYLRSTQMLLLYPDLRLIVVKQLKRVASRK